MPQTQKIHNLYNLMQLRLIHRLKYLRSATLGSKDFTVNEIRVCDRLNSFWVLSYLCIKYKLHSTYIE